MKNDSSLENKEMCDLRQGAGPHPLRRICDKPAMFRYVAMGGGWMYMCEQHGAVHRRISEHWNGEQWTQP